MRRMLRLPLLAALLALALPALGESLYVTDNILLGIHQLPDEQSPILQSVSSGTQIEVLERTGNFVRVQTADGVEGWINAQYLVPQAPAVVQLKAMQQQLQAVQKELEALKEKNRKRERETQILRDELANAKTTIKNLKKKLEGQGKDAAESAELELARAEIATLTNRVSELEAQLAERAAVPVDADTEDLQKLIRQNQELVARIEMAVANLQGERVPTAEELAAIHPRFPVWYWLLVLFVLVVGIIGGLFWFDYVHRKRHGGFRL